MDRPTKNHLDIASCHPVTGAILPDRKDKTLAHRALCIERTLTPAAKAVCSELVDHFNRKTGQCDPGKKRLADLTGYSIRTVTNALRILEQKQFIIRFRHGGGHFTNAYFINWQKFRKIAHSGDQPDETICTTPGEETLITTGEAQCPQTIERTFEKKPLKERSDRKDNITHHSQPIPSRSTGQTFRRLPPSRQVLENLAVKAWERHLRKIVGQERYADALEKLTPEICEAATRSEIKKPGSGAYTVLDTLKL